MSFSILKHVFLEVLVTLICLIAIAGDGNPRAQGLHELQSATYTIYDTEKGLPFNCVLSVVSDQFGRLWLNSCEPNTGRDPGFYLFNGTTAYNITAVNTEVQYDTTSWRIEGVTSANSLYGFDTRRKECFQMDPDRGTRTIYQFDPGEKIGSVLTGAQDSLYAITQAEGRYRLSLLEQGNVSPLVNIDRNWNYDVQGNGSIPTMYGNHAIWCLDGLEGFIRIDLHRLEAQSFSWKSLLGERLQPRKGENPLPAMTMDPAGNLIFYINARAGFYTFDPKTESLSGNQKLDSLKPFLGLRPGRWPTFYRDQRGNILIAAVNAEPTDLTGLEYSLPTVLLTRNGQLFDYSGIANLVRQGRYKNEIAFSFHSEDFTRYVLMSSSNGLIAVKLQIGLGIEILLPGEALRGIAELGPSVFLAITDAGKVIQTYGSHPLNIFSFGPAMEKRNVASFSKLVHFEDRLWFSTTDSHLVGYHLDDQTTELYNVGQRFTMFQFTDDHTIALASLGHLLHTYDLVEKRTMPLLVNGAQVDLGGTATGCIMSRDSMDPGGNPKGV